MCNNVSISVLELESSVNIKQAYNMSGLLRIKEYTPCNVNYTIADTDIFMLLRNWWETTNIEHTE